jgi:formimidoylglutamate deiminase
MQTVKRIWAASAYVADPVGSVGWKSNVLFSVGVDGCWQSIQCGVAKPADVEASAGPLLPSFVNAHSHAFQRAFAGFTERRESASDDFWSWRNRMYSVALKITPAQLQAIAAQLYVELLKGGYTQVCEFHYLSRQIDGSPYADPLTMARALANAAVDAHIGLTVLPVLYERAGFTQPQLRDDQRRFALNAQGVWEAAQAINQLKQPLLNAGLAIHSLRAAAPASIKALQHLAKDFDGPIHIHVAEQTAEVDDCINAYSARPIDWLIKQDLLDTRWQLVHATHTVAAEIEGVAKSGAGIVICPSTEANLGDGLADMPSWLGAKVPVAIGSDSHATRDALEELRWLEYGQRLVLRQRNIFAAPDEGIQSSAQNLFQLTLNSAPAAMGVKQWGLCVGARADALVLNEQQPNLLGVPMDYWLDAAVFSSPSHVWRDVLVAGRWVIRNGVHSEEQRIAARFSEAMKALN